jgi:hypothetical protein
MVSRHLSIQLARLIGPSLTVLTVTEMWNARIWSENTAASIYLNGSILFVAGLAIVQNHNIWKVSWVVLITLLGWGSMALGIMRMGAPEEVLAAKKSTTWQTIIPALMLLPIGICLTVLGYFQS